MPKKDQVINFLTTQFEILLELALAKKLNLETVEAYRRRRWIVRYLVTGSLAVILVVNLLGHTLNSTWVLAILAAVVLYVVVETLILAPSWATRPKFNILASFWAGILAATNGYAAIVASTEFYKAAAALVPVLFLAFVLEKKQEYQSTNDVGKRVVILLNVLLLIVAGKTCFDVLAVDDTKYGNTALVIGPIVFTVVSMMISLASPDEEPDRIVTPEYGESQGYY